MKYRWYDGVEDCPQNITSENDMESKVPVGLLNWLSEFRRYRIWSEVTGYDVVDCPRNITTIKDVESKFSVGLIGVTFIKINFYLNFSIW